MERVQSSQPDPQMASGALIHVPRYLGNLSFRVWKKMQDIAQNTPVILDPNMAYKDLVLSDDLTNGKYQPVPDNPERFDWYPCVLGSEVLTQEHTAGMWRLNRFCWIHGVTTASNQRKGCHCFNIDVWRVEYEQEELSKPFGFCNKQKLDCVRVNLDYDGGTVSFSDPVTNTHLHTFTTTFTHTLFPFFSCFPSLGIFSTSIFSFNS